MTVIQKIAAVLRAIAKFLARLNFLTNKPSENTENNNSNTQNNNQNEHENND